MRNSEGSRPADTPAPINIRALTRDDFPLLHRWLNTPHVRRWWRGAPVTPGDVERKYGPRVDDAVATQVFVIERGGKPIGMIQSYRHADHPQWDQNVGISQAAGIDYFIGDTNQIGRGVGTAAIATFIQHVFARSRGLSRSVSRNSCA